ncbi:MAG: hypothetical protein HC825_00825 [Oscillatoriales cyanobacterium RM1_1_9]|nr:hypothetical protein [Oscillatoriales cyanobacterium RM1_1_9]
MQNQPWLALGVTTLVVSTVTSVAIASAKPMAVMVGSAAGTIGGLLLSNSQPLSQKRLRRSSQGPKPLSSELDLNSGSLEGSELHQIEQLLKQQNYEITETQTAAPSDFGCPSPRNNCDLL